MSPVRIFIACCLGLVYVLVVIASVYDYYKLPLPKWLALIARGVAKMFKGIVTSFEEAFDTVATAAARALRPFVERYSKFAYDATTQASQPIRFELHNNGQGIFVFVGEQSYSVPFQFGSYVPSCYLDGLNLVQVQVLAREIQKYIEREGAENVPLAVLNGADKIIAWASVGYPAELAARANA